ncbi:TonB family protein [Bradyrhizobium sp. SZCCHNR1015]|uniref:energy transducer TonB n=1 Tax=Bradyrhizobium sp. SZCCHNR1015 TaxID=3057338 RepID=UPI002915E4BD|nr:TonB family protein [Bradyrhizobium sp. SZCCHNR1015]
MVEHKYQGASRRLWISAAIGALMLHGGGAALAVVHLSGNDADGGLGAAGAEFALEMASPQVEDNDLPPGPDSDAAEAAPEQMQQTAEVKESDAVKDKPTETEEEADRVVTQNEPKKPEKEEQQQATQQAEASVASAAQEESARKALDEAAPPAETAKAPNPGMGKDKQKLTNDWGRKISAYFELHKRYPEGKRHNGTVKVALVLSRAGKVVSASVMQSCGDSMFDDAALAMIRRSDPVPAPPSGLTDDQFSFSLDVNFNQKK